MTKTEFILPIVSVRDLLDDGIAHWKSLGESAGGIILRGASGAPTHERIAALCRLMSEAENLAAGSAKAILDDVRDVTPQSEIPGDKRWGFLKPTANEYSPLRTEGYNLQVPPRRIVSQVALPGTGGVTLVALADGISSILRPSTITLLGDRVYPVTMGITRLLWKETQWSMRFDYYEIQIHMRQAHNRNLIQPRHVEALSELLEVLDYQESLSSSRVQLRKGDVIILDNHRTLHGRMSLSPHDGERLIHRAWCY